MFARNMFDHAQAWRPGLSEGVDYYENVSLGQFPSGSGVRAPQGFELPLEPDNFRSRPLARQLGASAFLKAVVSQRMELFGVCAPGPQVEPCQPIAGSVHPERKSWNSGGSVEVPNGPVPPGVST